jgi:hypothetical protein
MADSPPVPPPQARHDETQRALHAALLGRGQAEGAARARSHCRFAPPLICFIPESLAYSAPFYSEATMRPEPRRGAPGAAAAAADGSGLGGAGGGRGGGGGGAGAGVASILI